MHLYLSYGRNDSGEYAKRLSSWLRLMGYDPWLDTEHDLPPDTPFSHKNEKEIKKSNLVLALLSEESVAPDSTTRAELRYAEIHDIPILPVRIADVTIPIQVVTKRVLDARTDPGSVFLRLPGILDNIAINSGHRKKSRNAPGPWWEKTPAIPIHEELKRYKDIFTGRSWLGEMVRTWSTKKYSRILLLTGELGIGKSAFVARLSSQMDLKGLYFFMPSDPESCKPESLVATLASQLARRFPEYREALEKVPQPEGVVSPVELFELLITGPMQACKDHAFDAGMWTIVLDGVDEAAAQGGTAMLDFLEESLKKLPPWVRVIATARPDTDILDRFQGKEVYHLSLDADSVGNHEDILQYIRTRIRSEQLTLYGGLDDHIVRLAAGNLLYAKVLLDSREIPDYQYKLNGLEPGKYPQQLGDWYEKMFRQRFPDRALYEKEIVPLLSCLVTSKFAVPRPALISASGLGRRAAARGLAALSQFMVQNEDRLSLYNRSLVHWLRSGPEKNLFAVDRTGGSRQLAEVGLKEVRCGKGGVSYYFLTTLLCHLAWAGMHDELTEVLRETRYIDPLYKQQRNRCLALWTFVETKTPLRLMEVYAPVVKSPTRYEPAVMETVSFILYEKGYLDEAMVLFKELERYCKNLDEAVGMARFQGHQAAILRQWGKLDEALAALTRLEPVFRNLDDWGGLADCLRNLGMIQHTRGDLEGALNRFQEQERLGRENDADGETANALGNQASVLRSMGQQKEAMKVLEIQEQIHEKQESITGIARCHGKQALILLDRGEYKQAMLYLLRLESISRELGDRSGLAACLGNKGCAFSTQGRMDDALEMLREQERICREIKEPEGIAASLGNQGVILKTKGEFDKAMLCFMEQEDICRDLKDTKSLAICYSNQALVYHQQKKREQAVMLAGTAVSVAQMQGYFPLEEKFRAILEEVSEEE